MCKLGAPWRLGLRLLVASLLLCSLWAQAAQLGSGHVDQVRVEGRQMAITAWAASERPELFITAAIVRLDGRIVYRGRVQRADRPDVVAATGRPDWLGSGISMRFALPHEQAPGAHVLSVTVHRSDGGAPTPRRSARVAIAIVVGRRRPAAGRRASAGGAGAAARSRVAARLAAGARLRRCADGVVCAAGGQRRDRLFAGPAAASAVGSGRIDSSLVW